MTPSSLDESLAAEWLCANGLGGYASGTVAGANTRRYHGLLVAALEPPVKRTVLVSKLEDTLWAGSVPFELSCNEWHDGFIHPDGRQYVARFSVDHGVATWQLAFDDWRLEKSVWTAQGENTTFVRYLLHEAASACRLQITPLCAYRDFHAEQQAGAEFACDWDGAALCVRAFDGAQPYWLASDQPVGFDAAPGWWRGFLHREERARGLDYLEDLFAPGTLAVALVPGRPVHFSLSTESRPANPSATLPPREQLSVGSQTVRPNGASGLHILGQPSRPLPTLGALRSPAPKPAPALDPDRVLQRLRQAAAQFLVQRPPAGQTVIAGYHWFADWGRDTMISLPGLALATGQHTIARDILRTFSAFTDRGMIPNTFGERGGAAYNNVDATLWFFHAIDSYLRASEDPSFLAEIFPTLEGIVDWHLKGTRYNIKVDAADGLLYAGEAGVQLTWMDAMVDGWVVTPRIGKPAEINALWFNAVCLMASWARELQREAGDYQALASQIGKSFRQRFWNPVTNCLFDVVDGPDGDDASVRPNQLFAVSLPFAAMFGPQAKAVVDVCQAKLLTPYGLRTLASDDPRYIGRYEGDRWRRDASYHQGTVWPWLIGPFVDAHLRVYGDKKRARAFLEPLVHHMDTQAGIGSISEIFDGDEPRRPRGCIAQAWSVAEVLRCWQRCSL